MKRPLKIIVPILLSIAIIVSIGWYLLKYDPDFTRDFLVSQARVFERHGSHSTATWLYNLAYHQSGNDENVAIELAEQYKSIGNYTKAEATLSNAIADGGTAELYIALCKTYVEQDKLLDAVTMLNNIADPDIRTQLEAMRPESPTASPDPGYYNQYITVSLSAPEGTIYVSTDKEYPSTQSVPYANPIQLSGGETTVSAIAVAENGLVSRLTILGYTIGGVVEEVTLTDPAIERTIREILQVSDDHTLYSDELWTITEIEIPADTKSLSDLSKLPFLTQLTINSGSLDGWNTLSSLSSLQKLVIKDTAVSAEAQQGIGSLPKLAELTLSGCSISGIADLSGLTGLTYLDLSNNTIRDLSAISGMTGLKYLDLSRNAVTTLDAIGNLPNLQELYLSYNSITSVAALSNCAALTNLDITRNSVTALNGLENLGSLSTLSAAFNELTDVSALAANTNLTTLDISDNSVTDISMLSTLVNMTSFNFSSNQVTKLPAFSADSALVTINGSKNQLSALDELKGLERLNYVLMDYNADITNVGALAECYQLVEVSVYGTGVTSVDELTKIGVIVKYTPI